MVKQAAALLDRPHIVVATPGRLADLLSHGASQVDLSKVATLVLDEADRLLESSFAPDMDTIFRKLPPPERRQTLCFSATLTTNLAAAIELPGAAPFRFGLDEAELKETRALLHEEIS